MIFMKETSHFIFYLGSMLFQEPPFQISDFYEFNCYFKTSSQTWEALNWIWSTPQPKPNLAL